MTFLVADQGAAPGGGAGAPVVEPAPAAAAAATGAPPDYKALLLQLLDLDPTADDAAIQAAFAKEEAEPEDDVDVAALQTKAASADDLQKQLDDIQSKYSALNDQQTALIKQKQEADADEILKVYEGVFTDDASKAAIRNILLNDKDAGIAILNGLKKPEPDDGEIETAAPAAAGTMMTAAKKAAPPSPVHGAKKVDAAAAAKDRADKISARAREIVKKSNPKIPLTKAYSQAEKELNPAA
jgi:hypothetical protein